MKNNIGIKGEEVATIYLKKKGFKILGKNYTNNVGRQLGEIDIIAKKKDTIVFVEVKTRSLKKYSETSPEENITRSKLRKLSKIANQYLYQKKILDQPYRFDAISVWLDIENNLAKVKHIESIYL